MKLDRDFAKQLDAEDKLARFRQEFFISNESMVYLDGNSLGRLPLKAVSLLEQQISTNWGDRLIRSWNESWMNLSNGLSRKLAPLIGASADEILFGDSTSTNLFKLAQAAMTLQSPRSEIISDTLNFPSDIYILQGVCKSQSNWKLILAQAADDIHAPVEDLKALLSNNTAVLSLSLVSFKSAYLYPMQELTAAAHEMGALVIWDLSHAVGALEIDLQAANVDMAIGCSYKYLNGGPGAPAFLYVKKELQEKLNSPIQGWFGDKRPFDFDLDYYAADGIQRFSVGTPPILSMAAIEPGLDMLLNAGLTRLRKKSLHLQEYMLFLIENRLSDSGFTVASPINSRERGSHLTLNHVNAGAICQALIHPPKHKPAVIPDFRAPNSIRFGIAPLYVSYEDIWITIERLAEIIADAEYTTFPNTPAGVT